MSGGNTADGRQDKVMDQLFRREGCLRKRRGRIQCRKSRPGSAIQGDHAAEQTSLRIRLRGNDNRRLALSQNRLAAGGQNHT